MAEPIYVYDTNSTNLEEMIEAAIGIQFLDQPKMDAIIKRSE